MSIYPFVFGCKCEPSVCIVCTSTQMYSTHKMEKDKSQNELTMENNEQSIRVICLLMWAKTVKHCTYQSWKYVLIIRLNKFENGAKKIREKGTGNKKKTKT